jgi:SNF2 family DNA or RNA helicase
MGLGKTIQAIAATEILAQHFGVSRVLVICPTSLKYQWQSEIARFASPGAAFASAVVLDHHITQGISTALSEPGKPWQNGVIESFNGTFRDECLSLEWFRSRAEAKDGEQFSGRPLKLAVVREKLGRSKSRP